MAEGMVRVDQIKLQARRISYPVPKIGSGGIG